MRSKQQPRPSFRWPQQRGDNLTGKYPNHTQRISTHESTHTHASTLFMHVSLSLSLSLACVSPTTRCAFFFLSLRFEMCSRFFGHRVNLNFFLSRAIEIDRLSISSRRKIGQVSWCCALYVCASREIRNARGDLLPVARVNGEDDRRCTLDNRSWPKQFGRLALYLNDFARSRSSYARLVRGKGTAYKFGRGTKLATVTGSR